MTCNGRRDESWRGLKERDLEGRKLLELESIKAPRTPRSQTATIPQADCEPGYGGRVDVPSCGMRTA